MRNLYLAIMICFTVSCSEPLSIIPGGTLEGQTQPPPSEWISVPDTIQLETRPSDPYSINIWSVGIARDLYISTSPEGTTWSEFIKSDPRVRARVGTSLYELVATTVTDAMERQKVADAYVAKYDLDAADNGVKSAKIFRLDRR